MDFSPDFYKEITQSGPPTAESREQLAKMEQDCEERKDPNSFYLTFKLGDPLLISWSHNTDRHLGMGSVDVKEYFGSIHPTWLPLHIAFGNVAYQMGKELDRRKPDSEIIFTTNVPLRHKAGSYHWYSQVSIPVATDINRVLIGHLNQYHSLCAYDRLVPVKPKISINGAWTKEADTYFDQAANEALAKSLSLMLTPATFLILKTYRMLTKYEAGKWIPPPKKQVREELGLSATAINKANVRLIQSLRGAFPDSVTYDVAGFAAFLNDLCGAP